MGKLSLLVAHFFMVTSVAVTHAEDCQSPLLLAKDRSTEEIIALLEWAERPNSGYSERLILVEYVQDQSRLPGAPDISTSELTSLARKMFDTKVRERIQESRLQMDYPKLIRMFFSKTDQEFNGRRATLTAHTWVRMKIKDLPLVTTWFAETMNHPALGNKIFRIELKSELPWDSRSKFRNTNRRGFGVR